MADVPGGVQWGVLKGLITAAVADSADSGQVPDEVLLSGEITITPTVGEIAFPTLGRVMSLGSEEFRVSNGRIYPKFTGAPEGAPLLATSQPLGVPAEFRYKVSFKQLRTPDGKDRKFAERVIEVYPYPAETQLADFFPPGGIPGVVVVVSHEDRLAAEASATAAAASAQQAAAQVAAAASAVAAAAAEALAEIRARTVTATADPENPDLLILTYPTYLEGDDGTSLVLPIGD
ncbi:hypothetical protein [Microbacterium rhizophilus]|uniref:hypothetical protein n=1 Tax=Microbacterium rhizophilus TaxID=3138934 RepID=UPI0031F06FF0